MRALSAEEGLVVSPVGTYLVAETWAAWCWDGTLCGSVFWGYPTERHMRDFLVFGERMLTRSEMAPQFDVITDGHAMEGAEARAFTALARFTVERLTTLTRRIRHNVIIAPPGLLGAAVVGLYPLLKLTSSVSQHVADDASEACRLIGSAAAQACRSELVALTTEHTRRAPVLGLLARYFAANFATASIERAARALGMGTRSLQRQLAAANTTFRVELEQARITEARRRLSATDDKLEVIADDLGFSSPTHFGLRFRVVTGELPSDYRVRNRVSNGSPIGH
jgi:AraC-like DNA-binding protein